MPRSCSPRSSTVADRAAALAQQDLLLAGQHQLALLVVYRRGKGDDTGRALRRQIRNLEHRIERIAGIDRLQEFRRLLGKGDQRVADGERKIAGPRCGETQDLEAVRQHPWMAALAAIFDVVMDRMVVQADGLERGEIRIRQRARRDSRCCRAVCRR